MRPDALFAYGTLLFPEIFEAVSGRRLRSAEALLDGWAARRLAGAVYPGLCRAPGLRTPGRVYFGVDARTWARLDAFEGEVYALASVEVSCGSGALQAGVYAVAESHLQRLSDEPWDAERFRRREHAAYLAACRRFAAGRAADPP